MAPADPASPRQPIEPPAARHAYRCLRAGELLPLFPLRTVLFPMMALRLHVFEQRYRIMMNCCLEAPAGERRLGVVLIQSGDEVVEGAPKAVPATPHAMGTSACVTRAERMADGQLMVEAVGAERFRIVEVVQQAPYLVAHVDPVRDLDTEEQRQELPRLAMAAGALYRRHLQLVLRLVPEDKPHYRRALEEAIGSLPGEPQALSFVIAVGLPGPAGAREKQDMLELTSTGRRLRREMRVLRRENQVLQQMLKHSERMGAPGRLPSISLN